MISLPFRGFINGDRPDKACLGVDEISHARSQRQIHDQGDIFDSVPLRRPRAFSWMIEKRLPLSGTLAGR